MMQDWPRKSEQFSYGCVLLQRMPRDPKLPWLLFLLTWPRLPPPVIQHPQVAVKGAGSLFLLLGCWLVPTTSYTFSLPHNSVKAESEIFQNGYDSNDGIKILYYSGQIPSLCFSKQYLKHCLFFESLFKSLVLLYFVVFSYHWVL